VERGPVVNLANE
jgi:hypothetical protein